MLSNLKLQIWNINWKPDDCLAEAVIPLWGFFELARRELEKSKNNPDKVRNYKTSRVTAEEAQVEAMKYGLCSSRRSPSLFSLSMLPSFQWVRTIPRQWVALKHPMNSDGGEIEVEIELLPKEISEKQLYKAAKGEDGFKPELNSPHYTLSPPNRPDDSFVSSVESKRARRGNR